MDIKDVLDLYLDGRTADGFRIFPPKFGLVCEKLCQCISSPCKLITKYRHLKLFTKFQKDF
jgi:hypothetical protein